MNAGAADLISQLRSTLGKMETALDSIGDGIAWTDARGRIEWCNASFARMAGKQHLEILGADLIDVFPLRSRGEPVARDAHPLNAALGSAEPAGGLYQRPRGAGVEHLEVSAACLSTAPGEVTAIVTVHDITRRVLAEEDLRLKERQVAFSQKLDAVGRLAGGIAHELNNMLTGIVGLANLIARDLGPAQASHADARKIIEVSARAGDLLRRLLAFGRPTQSRKVAMDINALIEANRKIASSTLGQRVRLDFSPGKDMPAVLADPGQLEQVLMNLYLNARDAMGDAGTITVETRSAALDRALVCPHGTLPAGAYVVLSVSDTGQGVSPESKAHIFEPFFTTKPDKGTGLGLSVSFGIIKDHAGLIDFQSEPGRGATFRVHLPATRVPAPTAVPAGAASRGEGGAETVLIVDDEPVLLDTLARTLASLGYKLLVAKDGRGALEQFRANRARINLILLDVVMPGLMGPEVHQLIRDSGAPVKILYMSGYASAQSLRLIDESGAPLLLKPFTPDELASKVRTVLDS